MAEVQKARILIVDDEPAVRMTLELALAETPHHVESVETAERALEVLAERPYDLMIVDKNLPGINGVELIRRVRNLREDVWSAMITGYPSAESAMEMLHLGVRGYLEKPFDNIFAVVRRVEDILSLKRSCVRLQEISERMKGAAQLMPVSRALRIILAAPDDYDRRWLTARTGSGIDSIVTVGTSEEVLALVRGRPPHLLVLDATLPRGDLVAFLKKLRELAPDLTLAVVCDPPSLKMITHLIDAHVSAVIPRPLNETTYRARIDGVLLRLRMDVDHPAATVA